MRRDIFDVSGRVALITGGLGQLGTQFVKELSSRGARVAVLSRSSTTEKVRALIDDVDGSRLIGVQADITRGESIELALASVEEHWGACPEILINNAGIDTQPSAPPEVSGPFETFPEEEFREVVNVNLVGTFLTTQVVGGAMKANSVNGSIINVGSIYGMVSPVQDIYAYKAEESGIPFVKPVAYSAAKAGIYNLTRYCATYWAKDGIRVNTLTPSGVRRETQDRRFQENYCARIPIGRMAEADEFNGAIIFMASDASRYMTGANVVVDGGWTAW